MQITKKRNRTFRVRLFIVVLLLVAGIFTFNLGDMTFRQKLMKVVYPLVMWGSGKQAKKISKQGVQAPVSFYKLSAVMIDGKPFSFESLKGKKVMLVNTASDCGFTGQYEALQQLSNQYPDKLVVIGFPANDFKAQESGSNEEIAQFCKRNYDVSFPMMQKSVVISSPSQHPVYRWLTEPGQNGWNAITPSWNFSKYLVSEEGVLTHYFDPGVSPLDAEVTNAIEQ